MPWRAWFLLRQEDERRRIPRRQQRVIGSIAQHVIGMHRRDFRQTGDTYAADMLRATLEWSPGMMSLHLRKPTGVDRCAVSAGTGRAARTRIAAWLLCAACVAGPAAAADKVEVGEQLARFDLVQPVTRHYLRHRIVDGHDMAVDIWTREVRFDERDGVRRLHIVQQWDGPADSDSVVTRDSWFEVGTFRPLAHERHTEKPGKSLHERFRFEPARIVRLAGPGQTEQAVESPQPAFNFETDMEFLGALPLAEGYEADIVFYHPGGHPPAMYRFRVAGSEQLRMPGGATVDCWLVTTDYNRPGHVTRFLLDKRTQTVLKVESPMPDGGVMVKTLLY